MLEALIDHQDGSAIIDARAASELELIEAMGGRSRLSLSSDIRF